MPFETMEPEAYSEEYEEWLKLLEWLKKWADEHEAVVAIEEYALAA
jgi:hypothetical protein